MHWNLNHVLPITVVFSHAAPTTMGLLCLAFARQCHICIWSELWCPSTGQQGWRTWTGMLYAQDRYAYSCWSNVSRLANFFLTVNGGKAPHLVFLIINLGSRSPSVWRVTSSSFTIYWLHKGNKSWHQTSATSLSFFGNQDLQSFASLCISRKTCRCA
jgi:hypothetical protein